MVDTELDEVIDVLEALCPGLDFATRDESVNLCFSSLVFAPRGAALLEQPATCVVKIASGASEVEKLFDVAELSRGRQGGALHYLGNGQAIMSVLHDDHASSSELEEVAYGPNWRFWSVDLLSGAAALVDAIDWNAGAAYWANASGKNLLLVPAGDYASTTIYDVASGSELSELFDTGGWSVRVFELGQ